MPLSHKGEWAKKHAPKNTFLAECSLCHEKSECDKCHGTAMPHPEDWMTSHSKEASFEPESVCFRCHTLQDTCGKCH
jgi:hypothetical protein